MSFMRRRLAPALILCLFSGFFALGIHGAPAKPPCGLQPPNGQWNATAQWLAGIESAPFAASMSAEHRAAWANYSKLTAADWDKLQKQYLNRIDAWRGGALANAPQRDLGFYPFSGPDIANMLAFFPDSKEYLLSLCGATTLLVA